jgi:rhamnulose-1-phosphate aldolase
MIKQTEFMRGFTRLVDDGCRLDWHERNGGNLSYRLTQAEHEQVGETQAEQVWLPLNATVPELGGEAFAVTGAGKFLRNVREDPEQNCTIIAIDKAGLNYRKLWGLRGGGTPTSELRAHLISHAVKKKVTGGRHRVIYHCHPANIIALTFVLPLSGEVFTRELWEMITECAIVYPAGVGVLDWMIPGSRELAEATAALMESVDVAVWAHHGLFCSGENFDLTFGLAHTVEKAAEVLVKTISMGGKRQTVSPSQLRTLGEVFHLDLPAQFLYEK